MLAKFRRHLTYANVVSTLCLFILLGGTAFAAATLKRNSVKNRHIATNAVTAPKVKNASLRAEDFGAGQLPQGAKGDPGAPGADGADGTAAAFARVNAGGLLDSGTPSQNENVEQANVQHDAVASSTTTGSGVYCFGGLPFTPRSAMVTADSAAALASTNVIASVAVQRGPNLGNCNAGHQQARVSILAVNDTTAPTLTNHGFYIWFEK